MPDLVNPVAGLHELGAPPDGTLLSTITESWKPSPIELFSVLHFQDVITQAIPDFHRASLKASTDHEHVVEMSPRGFGKSVRYTFIKPLFSLCNLLARDVLLLSASLPEAKKRLRTLRRAIEEKGALRTMYGIQMGSEFNGKWSDEHIELKIRGVLCSVEAKGINAQIRGGHYDLIIIDDPEETKGAKSPTIRAQVWDTFTRTILPTLNPDNPDVDEVPQIVIIGTPIHPQSLVQRIYYNEDEKFDNFFRLRFKALEDGTCTHMTGVPASHSIWEARWPLAHLIKLRKRLGERAFQSEYQCNPMPEGQQMWYSEFFEHNRYQALPPERDLYTVTSVDPAKTTQDFKTGSQTGIVTMSREKYADEPLYFVRGARGRHMTPLERARTAIEQAVKYHSKWIVVEETTASSNNASASDVATLIEEEAFGLGHGSKFGVVTNRPKEDKVSRGERLVPLGEQGLICFPVNVAGGIWQLHEQLITFPSGDLNDLVDAFHQAISYLKKSRTIGEQDWPDQSPSLCVRNLENARNSIKKRSWVWN